MPRRRRQNGFVKKTGKRPKVWTGYWYVYQTVDGVEKRLKRSKVLGPCSQLTKGDAEEKLKKHIQTYKPEADCVWETAASNYLALKKGDWSPKNRSVMENIFENHIVPAFGLRPITDIKPTDVKAWVNQLGAKFSYSLTHKCLTYVRAIFDQLVEDDLIAKNPARSKKAGIKMPKTKKVDERFLELPQCHALLNAAATKRDRLLLRVLNACALRPSEVFALQVRDVLQRQLRIDEAVVMGRVGEPKTEESNGFVPISESLDAELRAYISECGFTDPGQYLFPSEVGTPYDPKNYLNRKLKPLGVAAGVLVYERTAKNGKKIVTSGLTFQILRRTCATHFQKHGEIKDTQALLRHTSPTVTLRNYQKTLDESLIEAVESWDRALTSAKIQ